MKFRPLQPGQDRWGRVIAMVFAPLPGSSEMQSQPRLTVGEAIIDAGLARYEPTGLKGACRDPFLAAEAGARASGLGLWSDPYYAVIGAGDRDSFAEKTGHRPEHPKTADHALLRTTQRLGFFGHDFATGQQSVRGGSYMAGLAGQNIRVRGLLDTRFRPQIEISDLDAVEVIGQEQRAAASSALK